MVQRIAQTLTIKGVLKNKKTKKQKNKKTKKQKNKKTKKQKNKKDIFYVM
jgi:hypothetical protein